MRCGRAAAMLRLRCGRAAAMLRLLWLTVAESAAYEGFEELTEKYAMTDKARDDHGYSDFYEMMLGGIRERVLNMTEIGVAWGLSLEAWHDFFPNARLWGFDISVLPKVQKRLAHKPRIRTFVCSSTDSAGLARTGLSEESMDIIVDDGVHTPRFNELTLLNFWPLLRPGGLYFIEDVLTGTTHQNHTYRKTSHAETAEFGGVSPLAHMPERRDPRVTRIFEEHDVFMANTLVGHRNFEHYRKVAHTAVRDRVNHNSHIIAIRKRPVPRTRPTSTHMRARDRHDGKGYEAWRATHGATWAQKAPGAGGAADETRDTAPFGASLVGS